MRNKFETQSYFSFIGSVML